MAALQNAAMTICNRKPGLLDRQPPVITRGCLCFCLAIDFWGIFDRAHISILFVFGWKPLAATCFSNVLLKQLNAHVMHVYTRVCLCASVHGEVGTTRVMWQRSSTDPIPPEFLLTPASGYQVLQVIKVFPARPYKIILK